MELTFPFKNLSYNNLIKFCHPSVIRDYYEAEDKTEWEATEFNVTFYKDSLASFENELIQIIETSNQETIDLYFQTLSQDIHYVRNIFTEKNLAEIIEKANAEELEKFNNVIIQKEKDFLSSPARKRGHLEKYKSDSSLFPIGGIFIPLTDKVHTNYNFYCIEEKLKNIDPSIIPQYLDFIGELASLFINIAKKYGRKWQDGLIRAKEVAFHLKPILFCEGDIDIELISKAAELLNENDLLSQFELRQRGSCSNLDKLWTILTDNNWETVPQQKVLLYDCDTNRQDSDFGHIHRRMIPKIEDHIIQRGIENLFPKSTIDKAVKFKKEFVDFKNIKGTLRGVDYEKSETIINKDEKTNFSDWIVQNGTKEDFMHFKTIFDILREILNP